MMLNDYYTILVNKDRLFDETLLSEADLVRVRSGTGEMFTVERRTYSAYLELREFLIKEFNIETGIDSAYRSVLRQKEIMKEFIEIYGENYARTTVAPPGASEHHTGLALDIVIKQNGKWLIENEELIAAEESFRIIHSVIHRFGFILRYPKGRESITGYNYEPWHIRYTGREYAKKIYDSGLTMEEYDGR